MNCAVASGKGGTGKTTVALNLARAFNAPVQLLDCDVEEPNSHLFVSGTVVSRQVISIPVPHVDLSRCDACGECSRFCRYNAIITLKTEPMIFPELCHGCGGCMLVCPRRALSEVPRRIGEIETVKAGDLTIIFGKLDVGVAMAPPLIRAVKAQLLKTSPGILDAPPGASCPAMTTIRDTEKVLLVTEPTPFGLYDLRIAVEMVRITGIPFGVVINRVGIGDNRVHSFCREQGIPILCEIPDDRRIAEAYSRGELIIDALPEYASLFKNLQQTLVSAWN